MAHKKINRVILFGGNRPLFNFALNAKKKEVDVIIFTDEFRLNMKINELGTLKQNLEKEELPYVETDTLSKELVFPYLNNMTVGFSICTFWIFKRDIIDLFHGNFYNYHGARLPKERGGGTFSWKILSQTRIGGLTIHKVESGIDTGDIVMYREFLFPSSCRLPIDYSNYTETIETELLLEFLVAIEKGSALKPIPQMDNYSLYWPLINTQLNGFINWDWSVDNIELFINAFDDPYQGASTFYREKRIYLKKCFKSCEEGIFHPFQAGIVFRKNDACLYVAAVGGCLVVKDVFDEDGNQINEKITIGNRLHTPTVFLESAKKEKALYHSKGLKNK